MQNWCLEDLRRWAEQCVAHSQHAFKLCIKAPALPVRNDIILTGGGCQSPPGVSEKPRIEPSFFIHSEENTSVRRMKEKKNSLEYNILWWHESQYSSLSPKTHILNTTGLVWSVYQSDSLYVYLSKLENKISVVDSFKWKPFRKCNINAVRRDSTEEDDFIWFVWLKIKWNVFIAYF